MKLQAFIILVFVLVPRQAGAQGDSAVAQHVELLRSVETGSRVRVSVRGRFPTGDLGAVTADSLYLAGRGYALEDVRRAWIQQRSTRKGMTTGAIIGAPIGALFGIFVIWLADALCESDCDDISAGDAVLVTVGGTTFGLLAGGGIGAIVGAGIPRWAELVAGRNTPLHSPGVIGSFAITPVYARFNDSDRGGLGARATYTFQTPNLALGFEIGRYQPGTTTQVVLASCGDRGELCPDTIAVSTSAYHAGLLLRIGTGVQRRIEPFVSLGIGTYSWGAGQRGSIQLIGYSLGSGVNVRNRSGKLSTFAEGRWHSNLSRNDFAQTDYGFYTLGIGASITW